MKNIKTYLSLWHGLLTTACIILVYLTGVHISEALHTSSSFTFFNAEVAHLSWSPSQGPLDHYLLEITDTRILDPSPSLNRITATRYATASLPAYDLTCSHGHSYQVRVKAVAPSGRSSPYSPPSILFICDQKPPQLSFDSLPSPHKVRSPSITLTGSFAEPHLAALDLNGTPAALNTQTATFSASLSLAPGDNPLLLSARDLAGNNATIQQTITYAPLTIISLPPRAKLFWNGTYAYRGSFAGTTPQSYNQAARHRQTLCISLPGFQDYYTIIDFSDLSRDTYLFPLTPHVPAPFTSLSPLFPHQPPPLSRSHPLLVDYNLDGSRDLLVGSADGTIALFLNFENSTAPADYTLLRAADHLLDAGDNAAPFMADYNNDGKADLLVGNAQGSILYYQNSGTASAPRFTSPRLLSDLSGTPLAADSDAAPCLVDWNGDNRKDLLLGSGTGSLSLYLNQGSDAQPLFSSPRPLMAGQQPIAADSHAAPCITDWNADGYQDLLLGSGDGSLLLYYRTVNQEEHLLAPPQTISLNGQPLVLDADTVPLPFDLNQDGSSELIIGSRDGTIYLLN